MHRILIQLPDYEEPGIFNTPSPTHTTHPLLYLNSCRPDSASVHAINQAFLTEISNTDISSPHVTQIHRVCNFMEEYQVEAIMLKEELKDIKEINRRHKERECGKRHILKNTPYASTERIEQALREHEKAMKAKKKPKKGIGKRKGKQVVSSEDETDIYSDDSSDTQGPTMPKVFDCIEVA